MKKKFNKKYAPCVMCQMSSLQKLSILPLSLSYKMQLQYNNQESLETFTSLAKIFKQYYFTHLWGYSH